MKIGSSALAFLFAACASETPNRCEEKNVYDSFHWRIARVAVLGLGTAIFGGMASAAAYKIPNGLSLPQTCEYLPPHANLGTVSIEKNDGSSIIAAGLNGTDGPVVLYYKGTYESPTGQVGVFMEDDSGLPPEVKLLNEGGNTMFYGNTWGYEVHCDATNE